MGLNLKEILANTRLESFEVFEIVFDALAPIHFDAQDETGLFHWRDNVSLSDYDAVVDGLCMALVTFGGLDIDDLVFRLRAAAEGATPYNMTFPYNYEFRFIAK